MRRQCLTAVLAAALCASPGAAQDAPVGPAVPGSPAGDKPSDGSAKPKPPPRRAAGGSVFQLVVSADGSRVAASTSNKVFVWDVGSAAPLVRFRDQSPFAKYRGLALSKDGQWLLTIEHGIGEDEARVWSVANPDVAVAEFGPRRARADGKTGNWPIAAATFDAPGNGLVLWRDRVGGAVIQSAAGPSGAAWTEPRAPAIDTLEDLRKVEKWADHVNRVSFSPDGKSVAVSESGGTKVYSWPGEELLFKASLGDTYGFRAEFGGGGTLLLATAQRTIDERLSHYEDTVIAFDDRGRVLWERPRTELVALSRASPPCDALLRTKGSGVELVDALTGKVRRPSPGIGTGTVTAAVFTHDGRYLWVARRDAGDVERFEVRAPGAK